MNRSNNSIGNPVNTIRSYIVFLRWLISDSLFRNKSLSVAILVTGFLGLAFQVKVFGLIIYYARHFSSGNMIHLIGLELDPRSSMGLLFIGSLFVVILLLLSSYCIYFSKRSILRMGRRYEEFCSSRVFHILGTNIDFFRTTEKDVNREPYLFRLAKSDSRFCNRILCIVLSMIIPAVTLIISFGILFYLDHWLTLTITTASSVFHFYQYKISRQAAGFSSQYEKLTPAAITGYRELIKHCRLQARNYTNKDMVAKLFAAGPVKRQLDAYEGRLGAVVSSHFVSGIFMAVILGLIILIMGNSIIKEGLGWGRLLVYLVALRYAMVNLQNTFSSITSINRFYPQVRRYFLFILSVNEKEKDLSPPPTEFTLRIDTKKVKNALEGTQQKLILSHGPPVALFTQQKLNRYTLADLTQSLLGDRPPAMNSLLRVTRFASIEHSCPQTSLREALGLENDASLEDLKEWFPSQELYSMAQDQLSENFSKIMSQKAWEAMNPELIFILSLISAHNADCHWLFIEAKGFKLLGHKLATHYLNLLQDRINVIVYNRYSGPIGTFGEKKALVARKDNIIGCGSPEWLDSVSDQVNKILCRSIQKEPESTVDDDDQYELDEM